MSYEDNNHDDGGGGDGDDSHKPRRLEEDTISYLMQLDKQLQACITSATATAAAGNENRYDATLFHAFLFIHNLSTSPYYPCLPLIIPPLTFHLSTLALLSSPMRSMRSFLS